MSRASSIIAGVRDRIGDADPRIIELLDAWLAFRRGRVVPRKSDFDPLAVVKLMPFIWLYRFDTELGDFICRLAGEEVNRAWHGSIKDKTLRQVVGEKDHLAVLERWRFIIETPAIHYGLGRERLSELQNWQAERLILPLEGQERVDHLVGVSLYRIDTSDSDRTPLISEDIIQIPIAELDSPSL